MFVFNSSTAGNMSEKIDDVIETEKCTSTLHAQVSDKPEEELLLLDEDDCDSNEK